MAPPTSDLRIHYRRDIDGLRAVAVLPVILFHAGADSGFVGVDIFFVISGYLITHLIASSLSAGEFSLADFYVRRIRRILPALLVMLMACLPFAWAWLLPEDLVGFSKSLVAVGMFGSNFLFWAESGYFDTASDLKPLLHTWSLAVEEQYYLLFPLLLLGCWKWGRCQVALILVALALASLALSEWGVQVAPVAAFYLLPWRAFELLAGALLGLHLSASAPPAGRMASEVGSGIGLALLLWAIATFDRSTPFPGLHALVPVAGTLLVILFSKPHTWTGKLLGSDTLVGLGRVSYSAYLWHQPLFAFARHHSLDAPSETLMKALIGLSLLLAYVSWRWVELPFRGSGPFKPRLTFGVASGLSALVVALGITGVWADGFPKRVPESIRQVELVSMPTLLNGWCFYTAGHFDDTRVGPQGQACWLGNPRAPVKGLLFGDSHAAQYDPLWQKVAVDLGLGINSVTTSSCHPSEGDGYFWIKTFPEYEQCLLNRKYVANHLQDYDFVVVGSAWGHVLKQGSLPDFLVWLDRTAAKVPLVVIMASPRQFDSNVNATFRRAQWTGQAFDLSTASTQADAYFSKGHELLAEAAKKYPNVLFVDRNGLFQAHGHPSDLTEEGLPFSFEGIHLSVVGAKAAGEVFMASPGYRQFKQRLAASLAAQGRSAEWAPSGMAAAPPQ